MKDELGGKIMIEFVALRPKTYSSHKAKETEKCVIKRIFKFNDYKDCLFKNKVILKSQQWWSEAHCVYNEEINKIELSSNDDKRLQTFVRVKTYPYGKNTSKVCESHMLGI